MECHYGRKVNAKINHQRHKLVNRRNLPPLLLLFLPLKGCVTMPSVPPIDFVKNHQEMKILKKVSLPPIDFCQKSSKKEILIHYFTGQCLDIHENVYERLY